MNSAHLSFYAYFQFILNEKLLRQDVPHGDVLPPSWTIASFRIHKFILLYKIKITLSSVEITVSIFFLEAF